MLCHRGGQKKPLEKGQRWMRWLKWVGSPGAQPQPSLPCAWWARWWEGDVLGLLPPHMEAVGVQEVTLLPAVPASRVRIRAPQSCSPRAPRAQSFPQRVPCWDYTIFQPGFPASSQPEPQFAFPSLGCAAWCNARGWSMTQCKVTLHGTGNGAKCDCGGCRRWGKLCRQPELLPSVTLVLSAGHLRFSGAVVQQNTTHSDGWRRGRKLWDDWWWLKSPNK